MQIRIDLNELAELPFEELNVLKALVKLHAGQPMQQVMQDLSLDDKVARQIASYLVTEGGRQRLPSLFCEPVTTDLDEVCMAITRHLNQALGTEYSMPSVRRYVAPWYEKGYTEMIAYAEVIDDRAAAWRSEPKLKTHLRPATLFGSKFEEYRNLSMIKGASNPSDLFDEFTGI